ncbi:LPXTG-motif cell wall-anchored protein [Neobacillus sp. B4I6]|uniref:GDSL-type esterase/lipase family protein n=1 Tax=Neobacillus sp. B4I6 TaxID=3373925 RepID=UPI003D1D8844
MVKLRRLSILFILMLALNTFFSSFVFAKGDPCHCSLVALGDSITYGYHLEPNQTSPSPNAFPNLIGKEGKNTVTNLSKVGQTSTELLNSLSDSQTSDAIKNADIVTLYIGGNDLIEATGLTELLNNPDPESLTEDKLQAMAAQAGTVVTDLKSNLEKIIEKIKDQNNDVTIILYNLYNPVADTKELQSFHTLGDSMVKLVNEQVINPQAGQNGVHLANAYTAFDGNQSQFILDGEFSAFGLSLGIHPTLAGQQALAQLADDILAPLFPEKELTINLTQSPLDSTKEPVTIKVETNADNVQAMKWLPGTKIAQDFKSEGTVFNDSTFQVSENGIYTVYVLDQCGNEIIATIEIKNIVKDNPVPNPGDNPNPTTEPGDTDHPNPAPEPGNTDNPNPTPVPGNTDNPNPAPEPSTTDHPNPTPTNNTNPTTSTSSTGNELPQTATPIYNYLVIGLALILAGFVAMKFRKFKRLD